LAIEVLEQRKEGPPIKFSIDKEYESMEEEYPSHGTSAYLESPGSQRAKKNDYDYFRNQVKKNLVSYEDFGNQTKGMRVNGRKKVSTSTDLLGNKGMVDQL